jgi:dTDP-4-amino-4,6-dideoxygalactose transaminase
MSSPDGKLAVPIVRPALGEAEVAAASRVIRSGWVTQGPEVAAFEAEFAAAVGAPHAVAVANCTVALELALRCLGIGPGDDVVTASHSFIATANAVVAVGARPVFADIDPATYGLSAAAVERALTPDTKAILCVHQIGIPCDLAGLLAVARRRGLPVIEDAACAIGSEVQIDGRWERIGKPHGVVACFSFHPRKIVTTGDGGMLATADPQLAARARLLRQHAMSVPDTIRHHSAQVVFEEYVEPAFNCRMTDLQASIGRPQLARLAAIVEERRALADRYAAALAAHPILRPAAEPPGARSNWQSYPLRLVPGSPVGQREAMQFLLDRGVSTRRGVHNAHQEPAYAGAPTSRWTCGPTPCGTSHASGCARLAASEAARDQTVLIPLFNGMSRAEQDHVIASLEALAALRGSGS